MGVRIAKFYKERKKMKLMTKTLKVLSRKRIASSLILCTSLILSTACKDPNSTSNANSSPQTPNSSPAVKEGTMDPGGGNGLNNKMYESYAVNVRELPAFKKHLSDISNDEIILLPIAKGSIFSKTWYIGPFDLKNLSKEVVGVHFLNNSNEQIAIQTKTEVWIDQRKFEKQSSEEQADTILHEMVEAVYLWNFRDITLKDLISTPTISREHDDSMKDFLKNFFIHANSFYKNILDNKYEAQKWRALNATDYTNIRRLTDLTKNRNDQDISLAVLQELGLDFMKVFNLNGLQVFGYIKSQNLSKLENAFKIENKLNGFSLECSELLENGFDSCKSTSNLKYKDIEIIRDNDGNLKGSFFIADKISNDTREFELHGYVDVLNAKSNKKWIYMRFIEKQKSQLGGNLKGLTLVFEDFDSINASKADTEDEFVSPKFLAAIEYDSTIYDIDLDSENKLHLCDISFNKKNNIKISHTIGLDAENLEMLKKYTSNLKNYLLKGTEVVSCDQM